MPQKIHPVRQVLKSANIPLIIAKHLFGKRHTHYHRISIGVVLMPIGVLIAKLFHDVLVLHLLFDCVGYMLHGMGAVPIIDRMIEVSEQTE